MAIHDLPQKLRDCGQGHAVLLAYADELEAYLESTVPCHVSIGLEVILEVIVPDSVFEATMTKPTSCMLSTKSGDTRSAVLVFD